MKYTRLAYILPLGLLAACIAPTSSEDDVQSASEAVTAGGLTAALTLPTVVQGNFNMASLKVTNNSQTTLTNWQVFVTFASTTSINNIMGGEVIRMGPTTCASCVVAFDPGQHGTPLAPGASTTITFSGQSPKVLTNYMTLVSVDGEASGTPGAGWPSDGVDHIARAAASAAAALLVDYENTRLPNAGDSNYATEDGFILSAHMYTLNATANAIQFDPNAPGYKYISAHTQNLLAAMQSNIEVATYLSVGLQSCFASTNGTEIYTVKTAPFKGLTGAAAGTTWLNTPGGSAGSTDQYTIGVSTAPQVGADLITLNLKTVGDMSFGAAYATTSTTSLVSSAVTSKFGTVPTYTPGGGQSAACTPFNGPGGGVANPYFVISLGINGNATTKSPAWLQNQPTSCNNSCTSSLVIDPLAYQTPPAAGSTQGSTSNPFTYDQSSNWAISAYRGGYAAYMSGSTRVLGTFSFAQTAPTKSGPVPTGNYIWQMCGQPGAGC